MSVEIIVERNAIPIFPQMKLKVIGIIILYTCTKNICDRVSMRLVGIQKTY